MSDQEPKAESTQSRTSSSHADDATNSSPTPGPWHVGELFLRLGAYAAEENHVEPIVGDHRRIGFVEYGDAQAEANARLISAAPDLLEACEGFMHYLQQDLIPNVRSVEGGQALLDTGWQLVADGHTLVAKAKGG